MGTNKIISQLDKSNYEDEDYFELKKHEVLAELIREMRKDGGDVSDFVKMFKQESDLLELAAQVKSNALTVDTRKHVIRSLKRKVSRVRILNKINEIRKSRVYKLSEFFGAVETRAY